MPHKPDTFSNRMRAGTITNGRSIMKKILFAIQSLHHFSSTHAFSIGPAISIPTLAVIATGRKLNQRQVKTGSEQTQPAL